MPDPLSIGRWRTGEDLTRDLPAYQPDEEAIGRGGHHAARPLPHRIADWLVVAVLVLIAVAVSLVIILIARWDGIP